jgi:hypothetical protein
MLVAGVRPEGDKLSAGWRLTSLGVVLATVVLFMVGDGAVWASRFAADGCERDYDYSGVQNATASSGIRAYLRTVKRPDVKAGHVAGWVGVGGPGLGPNKTDEWVQVGYSAFPTGETQVYYEVAQPDKPPTYHTVVASLPPNAKNQLSVLELGGKPGSWQVLLNDKAVSPVISLPESHGRFAPQALGETWNAGTTKCNVYGYGFGDVQVASKPGGSWVPAKAGYKWNNAQQQSVKTATGSFTARSIASASVAGARREPPLLGHGHLASELIGHKVDTQCVPQSRQARFETNTLFLSSHTCAVLLGYAIAQPRAPKAGTAPAFQVATTALGCCA